MAKAKRVAWVLIGLPHSINDVLIKNFFEDEVGEFKVICTKEIKDGLVKRSAGSDKTVKWSDIESVLVEELEASYLSGRHVLVKHTNCKRSERKLMCRLLLHYGFDHICGIYIKNRVEAVLEDSYALSYGYTEKELRLMAASLEKTPPSVEEGFIYLADY